MSAAQRVVLQSVAVRGHQQRKEPDEHVAFRIEWQDASKRSSTVWRRYSEFVELEADLSKEAGARPPAALPPRHRSPLRLWARAALDEEALAERQRGLEDYLRAILAHKDARWRDTAAFRTFLAVPKHAAAPSSTDFTSSTWLDEQEALLTLAKEVRSELSRRDMLMAQGDAASRQISVSAKAKLANLLTRLTTLTAGLNKLATNGMAEGELRRRSDMVARLQDEAETLGRLAVASRNASLAGASARTATRAAEPPAAARTSLLGDNAAKPAPGRILGARKQGEETAETRGLDNSGLVQLQQQQLSDQDARIEQLISVVQRQKQLGVAIGEEIASQNELLDELTTDVDRTTDRLSGAKKQLRKLGS